MSWKRYIHRVYLISTALVVLLLFSLPSHRASGQEGVSAGSANTSQRERPPDESPNQIELRSRQFTPSSGIEEELASGEHTGVGVVGGRIHVLLQLYGSPKREDITALAESGIELLNYVPRNAWFASMPADDVRSVLQNRRLESIVRWAGTIKPEDKVPANVTAGQIEGWALAEDGRVRLAISFFDDVTLDVARQIVSRHGAAVQSEVVMSNKLLVLLDKTAISSVIAEDSVRWLDRVPPAPTTHNDGARAAVDADAVQSAPYNLSGEGVVAGIWDGGAVDGAHGDFDRADGTSRVVTRTVTVLDHATHVAGTMAGDGSSSQGAGGTDAQWRGLAPDANIVSYDFNDPINDYSEAISTYLIDLSQNSWGITVAESIGNCDDYGDYRYLGPDFDRIVRGEQGRAIPVVFSAGNERNDGDCGMSGGPDFVNYGNVTPPSTAKNTITVGAINSDDQSMTTFSSWGPVDDGRLKPDVVAPGDQSGGDGGITSTIPDNIFTDEDLDGVDDYSHPYDVMVGTSMAAPVVSGITALVTEQYRSMYAGANPQPSTVRALLVHAASDLNDGTSWYNPGPDYASGYGVVNGKVSVDLVRARALRQGEITADDDTDLIYIWVPENTPQLKVTLAWDDPAGVENAIPALVNDLDIALWEPDYTSHHTWVLDPSNPSADATSGWDDLNNLEQVLVANPTPGRWTIYVNGFQVPEAPQRYSIVSEALFDILEPQEGETIYAGSASAPQKIIVKTTKPRDGLDASHFQVTIGGQSATTLVSYEASDYYLIEVMPAQPSANGNYDLSVTVPSAYVRNVKEDVVVFADAANVDVDLVIDRSGSMGTDKMDAAKEAAKLFVDFMQAGDMIGVVSFSDVVQTNLPLTTIPALSSTTPIFSDDMESGTAKWVADAPWALTTASSHSTTHSWTDSPAGEYSNYANVSLRTSAPISIGTDMSVPVLHFWQKYDIETGYDKGYIEISTDGGSTWAQLGSYVTGVNLTWHEVERDLTAYKGYDILVRFRLQTDYIGTRDGWYIDDVEIRESAVDVKTLAQTAIDTLSSGGNTTIGGGLQRGQEQLSTLGNVNHPWAMILLTDGLENTAPYVADVLPTIQASKTVVHTVGLGAGADEALLLDIASQTGGTYNYAPTADELSGIYNTIAGTVTNRQTLLATTGVAEQGVTDIIAVAVDSTVSDATFSVSWSNSDSNIDLTLVTPGGSVINPTDAVSDPDIEFVAGSTYQYYRIKAPALVPGVWNMRITGGSVVTGSLGRQVIADESGEPYVARVTGQSDLTMRFYLDRDVYLTTDPVKLIATLSDAQPITGAAVDVTVQPPSVADALLRSTEWLEVNGDTVPDPALVAEIEAANAQSSTSITLFDDGLHGDGAAADGVYANTYSSTLIPGTYAFLTSASGTSNTGEAFTRQSELSTYIARSPHPNAHQVYMPLIARDYSPISPYGTVTYNGIPVGGIKLELRYYDGSSWSTYAVAYTSSSGQYQFTSPPSLGTGRYLYVRWSNTAYNPSWLSYWSCWTITSSTTDPNASRCSFDLDNVDLLYPSHGATVSLPYTFYWRRRALTSDNYLLRLTDISDYDPYWAAYLGYVGSYTLSGLPDGFVPWAQYDWWMLVYGPDGIGTSYYYYYVTFSNYGTAAVERAVPEAGLMPEMLPDWPELPQVQE